MKELEIEAVELFLAGFGSIVDNKKISSSVEYREKVLSDLLEFLENIGIG